MPPDPPAARRARAGPRYGSPYGLPYARTRATTPNQEVDHAP
jgi:hypothetical protein